MESNPSNIVQGPQDGGKKNDCSELVQPVMVLAGDGKQHSSMDTVQGGNVDTGEHGNVWHNVDPEDMDSGDVNMEASYPADDVMRAGGFGARDDISSFLPVASDSTDFEASLRDARDYEEPQKEISRPGLGWKDAQE